MESTERAPLRVVPTPSVGDALERAVDAAQGLVGDHIKLLQAEAGTELASRLHRGAAIAAGVTVLVIAWVLALATIYVAIVPTVGPVYALGGLSALNFVLGLGLLMAARTGSGGETDE